MSLLRKKLFNDYEMPEGTPEEWDVVEEVQGHYLAEEFARELLVDWDPERAMHRLGYYDEKGAARKGRELYKHPLVSKYLAQFMSDITGHAGISQDTIVSALWAEANDRSFGSSSKSRISALKALHAIISPKVPEGKGAGNGSATDEDKNAMPPLMVTIRTLPREATKA